MARHTEPTDEQIALWDDWVAERPPHVRAVAERFDPWSLYRMQSTGHRVTVQFFSEGEGGKVTLTVAVTGEFNLVSHERAVFGIDPDDLVPCDLPSADETLGAIMTPQDVENNIDAMRVLVRPDLFYMGEDGKATRKQ